MTFRALLLCLALSPALLALPFLPVQCERSERDRANGRVVGRLGLGAESCPYDDVLLLPQRLDWMRGWAEGRREHAQGKALTNR